MTATKRRKRTGRAELRRLADVIQREVDAGADTVEEIHRAVAALPLDVLEKLDVFAATARDVRKAQAKTIGAVYELIHKVNHEVGRHATALLDGRGARAKKAKAAAGKAKKAVRRRAAHMHVMAAPLA